MASEGAAAGHADLAAIERLMTEYAWHADHRDARAFAELFAPGGELRLGGQQMRGRSEIEQFCGQRFSTPGRLTRHVWSNLRLSESDESDESGGQRLSTTSLQLTFEQEGEDQPTRMRISDVSDEWQRDAQGRWWLLSRDVRRVL